MRMLAGRITAMDRDARTLNLGPRTFRLMPDVSLRDLEVGTNVSIVYEEADGVFVAVEIVRLEV